MKEGKVSGYKGSKNINIIVKITKYWSVNNRLSCMVYQQLNNIILTKLLNDKTEFTFDIFD